MESMIVGPLLKSEGMSRYCPCMCLWIVRLFLNDACCEGYCYIRNWHFLKSFPNCCDVLGVSFHLDFTRKKTWACLGLKVENFSCYSKDEYCAFSWVWTHDTCKSFEKDIPPWTQLNMVWLIMTLIALGLTNKNPLSI